MSDVDLANCYGATEGRTDTMSYRDAETHLKKGKFYQHRFSFVGQVARRAGEEKQKLFWSGL